MPLFIYQCQSCEWLVEKFVHNRDDDIEIKCEECEEELFERVIGNVYTKMRYNAKDTVAKRINPGVDRIEKKLSQGSDKDFIDVAGD